MANGANSNQQFTELMSALSRLDAILNNAISITAEIQQQIATSPGYRGLHISFEEAEHLLTRQPGIPLLYQPFAASETGIESSSRLSWLSEVYGLSAFDLDIILIALAPELDLRYERLYAYLQDDISRKHPTIDLALNLLCASREEKLIRRNNFVSDAPLITHYILHLYPCSHQPHSPLLGQYFKLDEQVVRFLLGEESLDARLAPFCQWITPEQGEDFLPFYHRNAQTLKILVGQANALQQPLQLYFQGTGKLEKRRIAAWLSSEIDVPLLVVNWQGLLAATTEVNLLLKVLFREVWLQDAMLYIEGLDSSKHEETSPAYQQLRQQLASDGSITILSGNQAWHETSESAIAMITVDFNLPSFAERRQVWHTHLSLAGVALDALNLNILADRYRLNPDQIAGAVTHARGQSRWQQAAELAVGEPAHTQPTITFQNLCIAARAQSQNHLADLARKLEPHYTWQDLVLPEDALRQLQEICQRATHHHQVLEEWGFEQKLSMGKGTNALFVGPSGTGKTMAAEVIAHALELDLYKIDLSGVVSKYIGETEKNLERIFRAAEYANAILLFDEADAIFGKRSEVRDSHDRYANLEISYLLQKMEQYGGIAILSTNLRSNLDEAFLRRLSFTVHFPSPDEDSRRQIWAGIWTAQVPLAEDINLDFVAQQFKLSGGNIKNIALAAAFLAAADGGVVTMDHILQATRREYQKLGKMLTDIELRGTPEHL
jgi:ABC-type dipeptide/oligopeptide/nickel transport system ATPase subunit